MRKLTDIFDRIDISGIFSQHLGTFYHYEKKKFYNKTEVPTSDKVVFFVFPVILTLLLTAFGLRFNKDYVNITLTCLSIFAGLLFGLLTMVFGLIQENQKSSVEDSPLGKKRFEARIDLTNHLFINIGFSIVLSLLALIAVLSTQFYPINLIAIIENWPLFQTFKTVYLYLANGISFFLLIEFLLTLMMIIRRFTVLFVNQTT